MCCVTWSSHLISSSPSSHYQEPVIWTAGETHRSLGQWGALGALGVPGATAHSCVFVFLLLCFALANCAPSACWCLTVISCGLACSICAPPCYTAVSNLWSSVSLLHASGVLLEFLVTVLSVLKCTFGFAFCPVAVYTMILCSCRPL
jgi:hypothetical protein